jgi:hypothetical protein
VDVPVDVLVDVGFLLNSLDTSSIAPSDPMAGSSGTVPFFTQLASTTVQTKPAINFDMGLLQSSRQNYFTFVLGTLPKSHVDSLKRGVSTW